MKILVLTLIAILIAVSQTPPAKFTHNETIKVEYDKFKGVTGVVLYRMRPGNGALGSLPEPFARNQIDISLVATYVGQTAPTKFQAPVLLALRFEPDWLEFNLPDLILLIDGRREVLTVRRGGVSPTRLDPRYEGRVTLPYQVLLAIKGASKVEGQFGQIEFHFDKDHSEAIKDFEGRLHQ